MFKIVPCNITLRLGFNAFNGIILLHEVLLHVGIFRRNLPVARAFLVCHIPSWNFFFTFLSYLTLHRVWLHFLEDPSTSVYQTWSQYGNFHFVFQPLQKNNKIREAVSLYVSLKWFISTSLLFLLCFYSFTHSKLILFTWKYTRVTFDDYLTVIQWAPDLYERSAKLAMSSYTTIANGRCITVLLYRQTRYFLVLWCQATPSFLAHSL